MVQHATAAGVHLRPEDIFPQEVEDEEEMGDLPPLEDAVEQDDEQAQYVPPLPGLGHPTAEYNEDADDDFVEGEEEEDADADDQACHMFIFRLYKSIGSYGNHMITIYLNNS